jgi:hypothetical protein
VDLFDQFHRYVRERPLTDPERAVITDIADRVTAQKDHA